MRKRRYLTWLGSALLMTGAALLGVCVWNLHMAGEAQRRAKKWLDQARKAQAARQPSVAPHAVRPRVRRGDTLAELEIPRLRLSVAVFEGDDEGVLRIGAGHIPGTALPVGHGNIGIAAHRDSFFRPLRNIHRNDTIRLTTPAGVARYVVTKTEIVRPTDIEVLGNAPGRDLTLVTCYPFSFVGHAPERFIVLAQKIG